MRPTVWAAGCREPCGTRGRCDRAGRAVTLLAYRFALDPTPTQVANLASHCGAARVAYNWGLAHVKAVMGQREAETTYGVPIEALTPAVSWSLYSLRKEWNTAKGEVAPWWGECSKEAFNTGLDGLARSPEELGRLPVRETQGRPSRVSPVQVQAPYPFVVPVHHRSDPLRDQTRGPAQVGPDQDARGRSRARQLGRRRCSSGHVCCGPVRAGPVVRVVHCRHGAARPDPGAP